MKRIWMKAAIAARAASASATDAAQGSGLTRAVIEEAPGNLMRLTILAIDATDVLVKDSVSHLMKDCWLHHAAQATI